MATESKVLVTGKSQLDGKMYAIKVSPTAYPDAILKGLGLTKVANGADLPKGTTLVKRNRGSDVFSKVKLKLQNGKAVTRFLADPNITDFGSLVSLAIKGAKIIGLGWLG